MNQYYYITILKVDTMFAFPWCLPNVLFLTQDFIQDTKIH